MSYDEWDWNEDPTFFNWMGSTNFGIKSAFGEDPGWYIPFLDIVIFNEENHDAAVQKFKERVYLIRLHWRHKKYKAS